MITPWEAIAALLAMFGLPLVAIGAILGLCEWSWPKPVGSLGSVRFLTAGGLLCLPLLMIWGPLILHALFR
jgi:hypothetical protein